MNRAHGEDHFMSSFIQDNTKGFAGMELHRLRQGKKERVATVLYWEASGQFCIETLGRDIPLQIFEELAIEAKVCSKAG